MEVRFLIYKGNKDHGSLTVKEVNANSPWRKFNYKKGRKVRIGKDIPEVVADRILTAYKQLFEVEILELNEIDAFAFKFKDLMEDFETINSKDVFDKVTEILKIKETSRSEKETKSRLNKRKRN